MADLVGQVPDLPPKNISWQVGNLPHVVLAISLIVTPGTAATFAHDIAPIIYKNCTPCHHSGGAAPFSLVRYEDVLKRVNTVVATTRTRYMPPWLPQEGFGHFANQQRLTAAEIALIAEWARTGAAKGPDTEIPGPPRYSEDWQLGTPDLIVDAPASFQVPAGGPDLYWNFVFRPQVAATRYVRAVEIRPGSQKLVHHANLLIDRQGSSSEKGFPGMDLAIFRSVFDLDSHLLFWKPGGPPVEEPKGLAWRLDPGSALVLNTHFHPNGKAEQVRPSLGLYFTNEPPTRFPLVVQLEHDEALHIPPGIADFTISDSLVLPMDSDVLAVYPHAHNLAKLMEVSATLPDGGRVWLIRIPDWNLTWQSVYQYDPPLFLPKGSRIEMRYHYDNSAANVRNPNHPPKLVEGGNRTVDEMGHLWLQILPRGSGDRRRELEEAVLQHRLQRNPRDFQANLNLGAVMLSRLNTQGAVTALRTAVAVQPGSVEAHSMLGLALDRLGIAGEAATQYQAALKLQPDYAPARLNLANSQIKAGKFDDAIENLHQILAANPNDSAVKTRLSDAFTRRAHKYAQAGQRDEAIADLKNALELDPSNETARKDLGAL
jgi:Flp pilus assembly protein TadD